MADSLDDNRQLYMHLNGQNPDSPTYKNRYHQCLVVSGLSPEEKLHGVKYIIESFVGCIKDMVLSAGKAASDLLPIEPLIATKHDNVQEGCINK